ncbi:MAG TPA: OmpA family protein [Verrucomicrobiae bacterium]
MKTTWIYSLAFALAVTLAATGCRHKVGPVTKLQAGPTPRTTTDYSPNTLPPGPTINNGGPVQVGGGTLPENWDPSMMNQDRAALAAYTIHFAYDSSVIRKSEQASLQSVAQALAADSSTKLLIEGNCDERGTEEYNRSLGERRALAAREALAKLGVDPMRIRTESFGKDKPADPGHDEAAWQKNRRDDFVLLHPKPGV